MRDSEKPACGKTARESTGSLFEPQDVELAAEFSRRLTVWIDAVWAGNRKALAADLRVSDSALSSWETTDRCMPLSKFLKLVAIHRPEPLLDWLCSLAGGCFVKLPNVAASIPSMEAVQTLQGDSARLVSALSKLPEGDGESAALLCRVLAREVLAIQKGLER